MPCRCDDCEPSQIEIELSKVWALAEELDTGKLPKYYGTGKCNHPYAKDSKEVLDICTETVCSELQKVPDITKYSLEMQIWWRNHQEADRKRIKKEIEQQKTQREKEVALNKLTPYERKLLGLC